MRAIANTCQRFASELHWKARHATFGVLIWILRRQPDPASLFSPFFRRIEDTVDAMLAQDDTDGKERADERLEDIGWEYDEYLRQLSEATTARAEIIIMADASFQHWLDANFPELKPEERQEAVERYRAGTL